MNYNIRLTGKFPEIMSKLGDMKKQEHYEYLRELSARITDDGPVKQHEYAFKGLEAGDREYVISCVREELKSREGDLSAAKMDLRATQLRIEELDDTVCCLSDIKSDLEYWDRLCEEEPVENPMFFDKEAYYACKYEI
jgi:hypothetical protein